MEVVLSDSCGNAVDAAVLSAMAALRSFRLPKVRIEDDTAYVEEYGMSAGVPLNLPSSPVAMSFALLSRNLVCDPSLAEQQVADALLSVAVNQHGHICLLHLPGGQAVEKDQLAYAVQLTQSKSKILLEALNQALREDEENRVTRILGTRASGNEKNTDKMAYQRLQVAFIRIIGHLEPINCRVS